MTRLFVELYLDEDVDLLIAGLVRRRGFQATTTQEAGRAGREDADQLAYAVSLQAVMLTHNRADYESLAASYFATSQAHCGIIIAVHRPPFDPSRRILAVLDQLTADEMESQLVYI